MVGSVVGYILSSATFDYWPTRLEFTHGMLVCDLFCSATKRGTTNYLIVCVF